MSDDKKPSSLRTKNRKKSAKPMGWVRRIVLGIIGLGVVGMASILLVVGITMAVAYPKLPDISSLYDYHPKLPMRILSADGKLIGEFGEEHRELMSIQKIPKIMIEAVLSVEDARYYEHGGVDYIGLVRAAFANMGHFKSQGASTITMQVARNVYLSSEKTFTRKIYEILLTYKLEHMLTKNQILEIYMNQIYLGNRAYGFAAASETYFGVPLKNITIAQAAMLAGLPKAPSAYNPISNFKRARERQLYIIDRMLENGYITQAQAQDAKKENLVVRTVNQNVKRLTYAAYVAEMARQTVYQQYGPSAYTRGLNVYTTIDSTDQAAAYHSVRQGLINYEQTQVYMGPEGRIHLPEGKTALKEVVRKALASYPDEGSLKAAVVLEANPKAVKIILADGQEEVVTGAGLVPVKSGLAQDASVKVKIGPGSVVRAVQDDKKKWVLTQVPDVQSALVDLDPKTGAIRALVGGFNFDDNKFNHVTMAWRQPGSSFKPFVYSAALDKGFTASTIIDDAPLYFTAAQTGSTPWAPKNFENKFEGPVTLKFAVAKSINTVAIQVLGAIGVDYARQWVEQFGFDINKIPPYMTMVLGVGDVTPMQMAVAYSVFANGGYKVTPYLITKITDQRGVTLMSTVPPVLTEANRVISARNAFIISDILNAVTQFGTGSKAQRELKRADLYGKTGTTNDSRDAWFVGFQPEHTVITWVGYDTPKKLGRYTTGAAVSLPIWINYMRTALKDVPVMGITPPPGVVQENNEWYYDNFDLKTGIPSLGNVAAGGAKVNPAPTNIPSVPTKEERKSILDFFKF